MAAGPGRRGIFYVRREHLTLLRPLSVGWNSVVQAHDFSRIELNLRPDASRYEGGSRNMVGHFALGASLDLLAGLGLGPDAIAAGRTRAGAHRSGGEPVWNRSGRSSRAVAVPLIGRAFWRLSCRAGTPSRFVAAVWRRGWC